MFSVLSLNTQGAHIRFITLPNFIRSSYLRLRKQNRYLYLKEKRKKRKKKKLKQEIKVFPFFFTLTSILSHFS